MAEHLDALGIRCYRGIGAKTQFIGGFDKFNFFIGENNSGKSIVLNAIAKFLGEADAKKLHSKIDPEERYIGKITDNFGFFVGKKIIDFNEEIFERLRTNDRIAYDLVEKIISALSIDGTVYLDMTARANGHADQFPSFDRHVMSDGEWNTVWQRLTGSSGGSIDRHWVPQTLSWIANAIQLPKFHVEIIPAKRQVGRKDESFDDLTGRGLIDKLATLQNPTFDRQEDREKFHRINAFLRDVTGKTNALLEVPNDRAHLVVHMDNKVLPLSSFGTGIHEVVLIAAFCTIFDGSIICMEEPEIHLHPILQRKLIAYLYEETSSQYFFATHSAVFLEIPDARIYHVYNDTDQTYIRPAISRDSKRVLVDQLGYRASDILQANAIVWVEGPSDRIYIRSWLKRAAPDLSEGVHYTVMFYGGGLISHLSVDDDALDAFIKLKDINSHMAIVLDSDKAASGDELKPHAQRIQREVSGGSALVWITAGREVENYIAPETLHSAIKVVHSRLYDGPCETGRYDHAYHFFRKADGGAAGETSRRTRVDSVDKVGIALKVTEQESNLDMLDLRERVAELAHMIRKANGLPTKES